MRTPALTLSIGRLATIAATAPASASCSMGTLKGVYGYYHGRRRLQPSSARLSRMEQEALAALGR